jgi:precorrin-4 methylase
LKRDSNHPAAAAEAAAWEEQKVYTGSLHDVTPFVQGAGPVGGGRRLLGQECLLSGFFFKLSKVLMKEDAQ